VIQAVVTLALFGVVGCLGWILVRPRLRRARGEHGAYKAALAALPAPYRPRRPPTRDAAIMVPLLLGSLLLAVLEPHVLTIALALTVLAVSMIRRERIERRRRQWIRTDLRQRAPSLTSQEHSELTRNLQRVYTPHDVRELVRDLRPPHDQ